MPARPSIPDPEEGSLQRFAYDLRQLGEGKVSVPWIVRQGETPVSRAALYAALSGTRLPKGETVSTLVRWWAGNPSDELDLGSPELEDPDYYVDGNAAWFWIHRLPSEHEGRRRGVEWQTRYSRLARDVEFEREFAQREPSVTIAIPPEQQRFINELEGLIGKTGLQGDDERWQVFGALTLRVERYLAGEAIPTQETCWQIAERCDPYVPFEVDFYDVGRRLEMAAELARLARVRDRRTARKSRTARG